MLAQTIGICDFRFRISVFSVSVWPVVPMTRALPCSAQSAAQAVNETRAAGGRVIPVGTPALRLIETAARDTGAIRPWQGETDIFIYPGYHFQVTDGLMTNFHLPKSTLLMLVSALMGPEKIKQIYTHAVSQRYRFFSYGDASLLIP